MKKYEFTGETKQVGMFGNITFKRIKAVVAFGIVEVGELGGWIEKEKNLSQEGKSWVCGNAKVCGNAEVYGDAKVCGDAKVSSANHILVIGAIGSRNDFTTFFRDKDNNICVKCGCFLGTIDDFKTRAEYVHRDTKNALVYLKAIELAKLQIELTTAESGKEIEDGITVDTSK